MTVELDLPNATEQRLNRLAASDGLPVDEYLTRLIESSTSTERLPKFKHRTHEEFSAALNAWIDSHVNWPVLSDEAISRESIYGEHH